MSISLWEAHGRPRAKSFEAIRAAAKIKSYIELHHASVPAYDNPGAFAVIFEWAVSDVAITLASDIPMHKYHADPLDKLVVDLMNDMIKLPPAERLGALALGHGLYSDEAL